MGKYLMLATEKTEPVLVRYRDKGVFALTLTEKKEKGRRSKKKEMHDSYFEQPEVLESIRREKPTLRLDGVLRSMIPTRYGKVYSRNLGRSKSANRIVILNRQYGAYQKN
jgi:hypothetical protein